MIKIKIVHSLFCLITALCLILLQCSGGFKSDSPNAPEFEESIFGSDSGG